MRLVVNNPPPRVPQSALEAARAAVERQAALIDALPSRVRAV